MIPTLDANTSLQGEYTVRFRGMGDSFPSRNYFIWYIDSDSYVSERYEFARGPNSVLFGDGNVGGIQTTWTKRPLFGSKKRTLEVKADSWGGWRGSFDVNESIGKTFAIRIAGLYQDYEGWRDGAINRRDGAFVTAGWRIGKNTELRLEGENGYVKRSLFPNSSNDYASYWNRTTVNTGTSTPSTTNTGIARVSSSAYYVHIPGIANSGYLDWRNSYRTSGSGMAMADQPRADLETLFLLPSRKFNLQPKDSLAVLDYESATVFIDQRLPGGFFLQLAANYLHNDRHALNNQQNFTEYRIDVNQLLPDGRANPKFGVPFSDQTRALTKAENHVDDIRMLLNWRHRFPWVTQTASAIAGRRVDRFDSWTRTLHRVNGTNPDQSAAENQYRMRLYYDEPQRYSAGLMPEATGTDFAFEETASSHQRKVLDYMQVTAVSSLLKDRLNVVLGARRDDLTNRQQTTSGIPTAAVTKAPQLGAVVTDPVSGSSEAVVGAVALNTYTPTSYNCGAVYYVLPWLGVTGNFSETFATPNNGTNLLDGTPPGVSKSKGKDFGLRFDLLEGRVFATLNYYISKQSDRLISGLRTTEINRIWTNLNRIDLANVAYRDLESVSGRGFEGEITANPTRSVRLMFNIALPRTHLEARLDQLRAYTAKHLDTWNAGAADASNPNRKQIATDIANIQNELAAAAVGSVLSNTAKYQANAYATYTISSGALKGVAFGGGMNMRGPVKVGAMTDSPFSYLYTPSYRTVSVHMNYNLKFRRLSARLQLNVANAFNENTLLASGYGTYRVGNLSSNPLLTVPNAYRYIDPRKLTLTCSFGF